MSVRKPPSVHRLSEHYRPSRHDPKPSPIESGLPSKPDWLSSEASAEWDHAIELLEGTGWLCPTDQDSLAMYAELFSAFKANPREATAAQVTQLRLLMGELGLTPATRGKMPAPLLPKENPFEQMFK